MRAIGVLIGIINPDGYHRIDDTEEGNKEYKRKEFRTDTKGIVASHPMF